MLLREYLQSKGLLTLGEFRARMGMSRAQAWNLWHGYDPVGGQMAMRIHEHCRVPLKGLLQLRSVERKKRQPAAV